MSRRAVRRRAQRWANQAAQEAIVRFGPEEAGLQAMADQAKTDYSTGLKTATGTAEGIIAAAGNARRGVGKIYDRAGLTQAQTAQTFEGDTATLGPVADSIKAGASLEQATGLRHLTEARAQGLADLSNRVVAAREGGAWAKTKARQDYIATIGKVLDRQQSLGRERGAFTAATMDSLMQADLDRQQQRDIANARLTQQDRNSLRSAGIDPDTGKPFRNGPLDPNSPLNKQRGRSNRGGTGRGGSGGGATPTQITAAQDTYSQMRTITQTFAQHGVSRQAASQQLLSGRDAGKEPVYETVPNANGRGTHQQRKLDPKTGTPVYKTTSAIPQAKSALLLTAALDMAYMGHLSRDTAKKLRARGLHPKQIGDVVTYHEWHRRQNRRPRTPVDQGPMGSGQPRQRGPSGSRNGLL